MLARLLLVQDPLPRLGQALVRAHVPGDEARVLQVGWARPRSPNHLRVHLMLRKVPKGGEWWGRDPSFQFWQLAARWFNKRRYRALDPKRVPRASCA